MRITQKENSSPASQKKSAYGPSRVEIKHAKDEVRIWEKKVIKRPKLREPMKVFVYGQFHRLLQLELCPLRSLPAALKDREWISRQHAIANRLSHLLRESQTHYGFNGQTQRLQHLGEAIQLR